MKLRLGVVLDDEVKMMTRMICSHLWYTTSFMTVCLCNAHRRKDTNDGAYFEQAAAPAAAGADTGGWGKGEVCSWLCALR